MRVKFDKSCRLPDNIRFFQDLYFIKEFGLRWCDLNESLTLKDYVRLLLHNESEKTKPVLKQVRNGFERRTLV